MNQGLSDRVREMAQLKYVRPALQAGKREFSIRVRDISIDLRAVGFPARHTPQICSALQTSKFLRENGIEIAEVTGPPKKVSPTVVVRYRVADRGASELPAAPASGGQDSATQIEETPEEWAHRVTGKIRGLLKDEIAEFGGAEGFIRWVRGYDEDDAE